MPWWQSEAQKSMQGLEGASQRMLNQDMSANPLAMFLSSLPSQTATNLSTLGEELRRTPGLASGTRATVLRKATPQEAARTAALAFQGYSRLQDLIAEMKRAGLGQFGQMQMGKANLAVGRESTYMQNTLDYDQMAQEKWMFEKQLAEQAAARKWGLAGQLGAAAIGGASSAAKMGM